MSRNKNVFLFSFFFKNMHYDKPSETELLLRHWKETLSSPSPEFRDLYWPVALHKMCLKYEAK